MRIAFTPDPLNGWHRLYHVMLSGAFRISQIDEADIVFNWCTMSVYCDPLPGAVNGLCTDVSKTMVEQVFSRVYGYGSTVTSGVAVEKPVAEQGKKNAKLVNLDYERMRPGHIYQRVLCDVDADYMTEDRYVIMRGEPVLLTRKKKIISPAQITGKTIDVEVITPGKDKRMVEFCRQMGLDFGELDVIVHDGREYIIDVNNIAGDALFFSSNGEQIKQRYIELFKKHYL